MKVDGGKFSIVHFLSSITFHCFLCFLEYRIVMLKKNNRLNGKQINWLMGRGRKMFGKHFGYVVFPQRHFIPQTQWSITIPVKLDKRATMRNLLKRHARIVFLEQWHHFQMPTNRQCFIYVNKKVIDELKQRIATENKTAIINYWITLCRQDFSSFFRQLWLPASKKLSHQSGSPEHNTSKNTISKK